MITLEKAIQEKQITFATHINSPSVDFLEVLKETEKAVFVKHDVTNKTVWLPKSSFQHTDNNYAFTITKRFRMLLKKQNNNYTFYALGLIG